MKNTDIMSASPYSATEDDQEDESSPRVGSTDTSARANQEYGLNPDYEYDDMCYENDIMPEDEDDIINDKESDDGLSELSNEELYF